MTSPKIRDFQIIEQDINNLLDQIHHHQLTQDEQCETLLNQNQLIDEQALEALSSSNQYNSEVNYFKEFWRYYIMNEIFIKKINELSQFNLKMSTLADDLEDLQNEYSISIQQRNKKKNRRTSQEIQKSFLCPYDKCNKQYGSDVSLNLHIKLKHDGGNKTDREKYAKMILQAQENGQNAPEQDIKFPPGYLENFNSSATREKIHKQVKLTKPETVSIFYDD